MVERKPLWEVTFRLENGSEMTCLEEADSGDEAFDQITSVWGPPSPIVTFQVSRKSYFQIHIPSLEESVRLSIEAAERRRT
ncbi:hypothetical protein ACFW2V_14095 [Streptomyces sp. NPDC058947]|uniref:hypothetical protein n=1 Tax=Streptomyces sp. NPDC058947 TaxID=3346675 RepID=UPI0036B75E8D